MDSLPTWILCTTWVPGATEDQKRTSDSLDLELQMVVSCYVDVKNWIRVPWKNSQYSLPWAISQAPVINSCISYVSIFALPKNSVITLKQHYLLCAWHWWVCVCTTACTARGQLQGAGFPFPLNAPRDGTQIIWLGDKCPDLLRHLARPESSFFSSKFMVEYRKAPQDIWLNRGTDNLQLHTFSKTGFPQRTSSSVTLAGNVNQADNFLNLMLMYFHNL